MYHMWYTLGSEVEIYQTLKHLTVKYSVGINYVFRIEIVFGHVFLLRVSFFFVSHSHNYTHEN